MGQQQLAGDALGLVEVIVLHSERTIKSSVGQREKEAAEFVEIDRTCKAMTGASKTQLRLQVWTYGNTDVFA